MILKGIDGLNRLIGKHSLKKESQCLTNQLLS